MRVSFRCGCIRTHPTSLLLHLHLMFPDSIHLWNQQQQMKCEAELEAARSELHTLPSAAMLAAHAHQPATHPHSHTALHYNSASHLSIVTISTLALLDFLDLDSTTCFFQLGTQLLDFCFDLSYQAFNFSYTMHSQLYLGSCCIVSLPHCVKLFVFFSNRRSTLLTALLGLHSPTEVF